MNIHCMNQYFYSNFLTKVHNKSYPVSGGGAGGKAGGKAGGGAGGKAVFLKSP